MAPPVSTSEAANAGGARRKNNDETSAVTGFNPASRCNTHTRRLPVAMFTSTTGNFKTATDVPKTANSGAVIQAWTASM